jgi:DNA polymerase III epsilon subunit
MGAVERYTALDIETTGLYPQRGHRIIEIGAVSIEGDLIAEEFWSLVNIDRDIPDAAKKVHGITDEMLKDQPGYEEVIPRLIRFLRDSTIIAHNAKFDVSFLRYEAGRLSLALNNRYICTMEMSRKHFPGLPNYKLDTVYRYLFGEIPEDIRRHRALDDARMAARIWMEMVK